MKMKDSIQNSLKLVTKIVPELLEILKLWMFEINISGEVLQYME